MRAQTHCHRRIRISLVIQSRRRHVAAKRRRCRRTAKELKIAESSLCRASQITLDEQTRENETLRFSKCSASGDPSPSFGISSLCGFVPPAALDDRRAFYGKGGGRLAEVAEYCFTVPSYSIHRIQESHVALVSHVALGEEDVI